MDANEREWIDEKVRLIVGAAFEVSNQLGCGFLEKVYERSLQVELNHRGMAVEQQIGLPVFYKGKQVGDFVADLMVEKRILVELKCVDALGDIHTAQCINYLKASGLKVCLLVNFQRPRIQWKKLVNNL
ncbi:GxxExxY protein [Sedimenticola sp.]|uniref:GxxExxY protein n=1 Tax=Sedimenticola sp. TaxID=1940285 RepID=UPI003D0A5675